jgi:PhoH-like ATPase
MQDQEIQERQKPTKRKASKNQDYYKYDKIYVLDTNIILNNASNIELLSEQGKNLIVLPEVVLDELDSKKTGWDEINFQARSFGRILQDAKIVENTKINHIHVTKIFVNSGVNADIHILAKESYLADSQKFSGSILNDRKIIEIAKDAEIMYDSMYNADVIFISLDIMARTRAVSMQIQTETLKITDDLLGAETKTFFNTVHIDNYENTHQIPQQDKDVSGLHIIDDITGLNVIYYIDSSGNYVKIDEKNEDRIPAVPKNARQKILTKAILDEGNDIVVINGAAGTGKNYITLGAAIKLMELHKDKYTGIIYLRKTVISGDKEDELGFLPGTKEEKIAGYMQPMEDSIRNLIINKYHDKKLTPLELDENIKVFKEKYNIQYSYVGHLRGSTFPKGSIILLDESQNWSHLSARTILSRVGESSKLIIMGSNNQIDTPFLGKSNNALTFMMSQCGKDNSSGVKIKGVNLINVIRSKIAEYADIAFERTK